MMIYSFFLHQHLGTFVADPQIWQGFQDFLKILPIGEVGEVVETVFN
jgi:hypothetical protein